MYKQILSVMICVLMLSSVVSAAFVGGNLNLVFSKAVKEQVTPDKTVGDAPQEKTMETVVVRPIKVNSGKHTVDAGRVDESQVIESEQSSPVITTTRADDANTIERDHSVFIVGLLNGDIYAYDSNNFKLLWKDTTSFSGAIMDSKFDGTSVYVAGYGKISEYESNTGKLLSVYSVTSGAYTFAFDTDANYIYAGDSFGNLHKITKWGGATETVEVYNNDNIGYMEWDNIESVRIGSDDYLYVAGGTGYVKKYDKDLNFVSNVYSAGESHIYTLEMKGSKAYFIDSTKKSGSVLVDQGDLVIRPGSTIINPTTPTQAYDMVIDGDEVYTAQKNGRVGVWSLSTNAYADYIDVSSLAMETVDVNDNFVFAGGKNFNLVWFDKLIPYPEAGRKSFSSHITEVNVEYTTKVVSEVPHATGLVDEQTITEDSSDNYLFNANDYFTDFEDDPLEFLVVADDKSLVDFSVDDGKVYASTVTKNKHGETTATIKSYDVTAGYGDEITFVIKVTPVNDAPTAKVLMADQLLNENSAGNELFDLTEHFADVDGDSLTFRTYGYNNELVNVDIKNDVLYVDTMAVGGGVTKKTDVTVEAKDGNGLIATSTFTITVSDVNDKPTAEGVIPKQFIKEDSYNNFLFNANDYVKDIDGDTLRFSVKDNSNVAIATVRVERNGEVYASVGNKNIVGTVDITINASDYKGIDWQDQIVTTFALEVTPVNDAPVLTNTKMPDQSIDEDSQNVKLFDGNRLSHYFGEVDDGDVLSYTASDYDELLVSINIISGGWVTASTVTPDAIGSTSVTITADDGEYTVSDSFVLTVVNTNDGPVTTNTIGTQVMEEDSKKTLFDLDNHFEDPDGEDLNYDLSRGKELKKSCMAKINSLTSNTATPMQTTVQTMSVKDNVVINKEDLSAVDFQDCVQDNAPKAHALSYSLTDYDTDLVTLEIGLDGVVRAETATKHNHGQTYVTATATDGSGATASQVFSLIVTPENDAPKLNVIPTLTAYINTPFAYTIVAVDVDGDDLVYKDDTPLFDIDESTGVISFTPVQSDVGQYVVEFTVRDASYTYDSATINFNVVDNEDPDVTITSPLDGAYFNVVDVTVSYTSTATDIDRYYLWKDNGAPFNNGMNLDYEFTGLTPGAHTLNVRVVDEAGNTGMDSVDVTVDLIAPTITIDNPIDGSNVTNNQVDIDWTGADNYGIDYYLIEITGDATLTATRNANNPSYSALLNDGNYVATVTAYDFAGNTAVDTISFGVDTTVPDVTITYPAEGAFVNSGVFDVTWTSTATDIDYYEVNGTNVGTQTTFTTNLVDGDYQYIVTAFDFAGLNSSANVNFTVDTDSLSVAITNPLDGAILNNGNVDLQWIGADDNGIDHYEVNGTDVGLNTNQALVLADDNYTYVVTVFDLANNNATDTVNFEVDTSLPDVTITYPTDGTYLDNGVFDITWTSIATDITHYEVNGTDVGLDTIYSVNLVDNDYTFNVTAFDSANNNFTDTVSFTVDTVDPVILIASVNVTTTNSSATIEWMTSEPADSIVYYGLTTAYGDNESNATFSAYHNLTITGLTANTTYEAMLGSTDPANHTVNHTLNFTTQAPDNFDPVAVAVMTSPCYAGGPCAYDGTGSSDSDGFITTYAWDFNGTGTSSTATGTWVFVAEGNYTVELTVTDNATANNTAYVDVEVLANTGIAPVANAGPDQIVPIDTNVTFDGSASTDNIGIDDYTWEMINGPVIGGGVSPVYNFTTVGLYTVTLTVRDVEGLTDTDNVTIAVYDPTAVQPDIAVNNDGFTINPQNAGLVDATIKVYNLGNTTTDNFTVRVNYTAVDFTETNVTGLANGVMVPVTMGITLPSGGLTLMAVADHYDTVTESNETNNVASMSFVDLNALPVAVIWASTATPNVNEIVDFNGFGSSDSDGIITQYEWDFGDGSNSTGNTTTHSYSSAATYTVTLTVTDDDGDTDTDTMLVVVGGSGSPAPPGSGPTGTSGISLTPRPGTNVTIPEEPIFIDDLVTYEVGDFIITRDYFYNPNTGNGWYTLNIENTGDSDYVIKLEDANPYSTSADIAAEYTVGNRLGWETGMDSGDSFEVVYSFDEELSPNQVKGIGVPVIEDITPEPVPTTEPPVTEPTEPEEQETSPFTGLLTFLNPEFWQSWIAVLVVLAVVVMMGVAWVLLKEQGYGISLAGKVKSNAAESPFEEVDFNQPSGYAEGTLY